MIINQLKIRGTVTLDSITYNDGDTINVNYDDFEGQSQDIFKDYIDANYYVDFVLVDGTIIDASSTALADYSNYIFNETLPYISDTGIQEENNAVSVLALSTIPDNIHNRYLYFTNDGELSATLDGIITSAGTAGQVLQLLNTTENVVYTDYGWVDPTLGDVVGPTSAVGDNIVIYDSTTGKLIKDGGSSVSQINSDISSKENIIIYGTSGQFMTTNDFGDGYEWTDNNDPVDYTDYIPQASSPDYEEGRLWYDGEENTLRFDSHNPNFINYVNNAQTIRVRNETGDMIPRGTIVDIRDSVSVGIGIQMHVANSYSIANNSDYGWVLGVTTEDVLDGDDGTCCFYGTILGVDTVGLSIGQASYLGTSGNLTNTRPDYPASSILVGASLFEDATDGVLAVKISEDNYDYEFDGTILEKQDTVIVVDGGEVYMDVSNLEDPTRNLPIQLAGSIYQLDTTTGTGVGGAARVLLTQGTSAVPQLQQVYVYIDSGVATIGASIGTYPSPQFAGIATVVITDDVDTLANDAILHRRMTSAKAHNGRGRISYITERMYIDGSKWWAGVSPTATLDQGQTPDLMDLSVLAGVVYQTHRQSFPALSVNTDSILLVNGENGAGLANYTRYTNLTELCGYVCHDMARDTNCRGHIVIGGLINKSTQECHLFASLPNSLYSGVDGSAYHDYNNTANRSVPFNILTTAFLIAQIPYDMSNANSVTFLDPDSDVTTDGQYVINLLGTPLGVQGGGSSGGGTYIPNLIEVLGVGNDAGNAQITNLADGALAQDAVAYNQVTTHTGNSTIHFTINDIPYSKAITIPLPVLNDEFPMWITTDDITVTDVRAYTNDGEITYNISDGTTNIFTVSNTATSATKSTAHTTIDTQSIDADDSIVVAIDSVTTAVTEYVNITVYYTID